MKEDLKNYSLLDLILLKDKLDSKTLDLNNKQAVKFSDERDKEIERWGGASYMVGAEIEKRL